MFNVRNKLKRNNGNSNTIEMLFIIIILFMVTITIIDTGIYFSNRYILSNAAQNGARIASVFGGVQANSISRQYGITDISPECNVIGVNSVVACSVLQELIQQKNDLIEIRIKKVECGPNVTTRIGDRTYCKIEYQYRGLPGFGLSFIDIAGNHEIIMTSESEVVHH